MENHIINIDSSYGLENKKLYKLSSHFTYVFEHPLKNIIEMNLSSIELPNTSYLISKKKNNFFFNIKYNDIVTKITLNNGNYLAMDLHVIIEKQLKEIDDKFECELIPYQLVFKIYHSDMKEFSLDFTCETEYNSLGNIMGFTNNIYENNYVYTSEKIVNIIDNNYCFLKVNDYGHVYHNKKKYLSKIIMSSQKYEMVFDGRMKYVSKTVIFQQPINLSVLHIGLDDALGKPLNLNGIPFSLTLEVKVIKNQLLKRYKELTFYNPELMELILNDVMLTYYTNENKEIKIGESYDTVMTQSMVGAINNEDNDVDNTIKMINNINVEKLSLLEVEEIDKKHYNAKKKKKLEKLIKKFKKKYPEKYNELKKDKKELVKTVINIVNKKKEKKEISGKIIYD